MTIRDIKILLDIIKKKLEVGLSLDSSINYEFQKNIRHKNFIFSNGIDLIHEFFDIERKMKSNFLTNSVKLVGNYPLINKIFIKVANKGVLL
jgi:2-octaprenyl-6-methoxyphenol hydroxylase